MMKDIVWHTRGVDMPLIDTALMARWLDSVADNHGRRLGTLTYIFTDDEGILDVNREFLSHDYFTDIITFDYSKRRMVSGDIFISLDTVRSNAEMLGVSYDSELMRVIVHGLLHLCGINDKGPGERAIMEQHENQALELLTQLHSDFT